MALFVSPNFLYAFIVPAFRGSALGESGEASTPTAAGAPETGASGAAGASADTGVGEGGALAAKVAAVDGWRQVVEAALIRAPAALRPAPLWPSFPPPPPPVVACASRGSQARIHVIMPLDGAGRSTSSPYYSGC